MAALFQTVLMRLALCGLAASLVLLALRSRIVRDTFARLLSVWRSLTAFGRVAVCSFLLIGILIGGNKTNNVPPNINSPLPQMQHGGVFLTGFTGLSGSGNLVNLANPVQTTSAQCDFAERKTMNWNLRGAWKDSFWLPFEDGWVFPWGTNHLYGVEVVSYGQVWLTPFDTNAVASAGAPFEIVRGLTTFGYELTPSNSYRFVWTDAAINRDTNNLVSAALELFRNGDVSVTTNGVAAYLPRVDPDDWDGDGIANELDQNPYLYDGDFYGVAKGLPDGATTNAYYWLDLCATGFLDSVTVRVTSDGASDLGDHIVIARTNQVCHIPLLAGATYTVDSNLPIGYSAVSSEYAEIVTNAENRLVVFLPLELYFERVQMRGGSDTYIAHTSPVDVGPRILNITGGCCSCVTNENGFSWSCFPQCLCGGSGHSLSGAAKWEGYSYPFLWWGRCHCYYEDQTAIDEIESRGVSLEILDASGNAIEWRYPVLVGESVIVQATVGGSEMTVSDFVGLFGGRIRLKAYYVDFVGEHDIVGAAIPISVATTTFQGQNVFRVSVAADWLQSNGIVRNAEDGIVAKTSVDMSNGPDAGSDRIDSDCFDENTAGRLYGRARGRWGGNGEAQIPEGEFNIKTVQAAGTACLIASCGTSCSANKQCQQQADVFYYSGHGEHDTGRLYGAAVPADVTNHWRDVDTLIFAGCAVLDVGDKGNHYSNPASHSASPGLKWVASSGASALLGYCWKAPLDSQGSVQILSSWCANRSTLGDVEAWMRANDNMNGRNACAIRLLQGGKIEYRYFRRGNRGWNLRSKYSEIVEEINL